MRFHIVWSSTIRGCGAVCLHVSGLNVCESMQTEKKNTHTHTFVYLFFYIYIYMNFFDVSFKSAPPSHHSFCQCWHLSACFTSPVKDSCTQSHYKPDQLLMYHMCSCGAMHHAGECGSISMYAFVFGCMRFGCTVCSYTQSWRVCVVPRFGRIVSTFK